MAKLDPFSKRIKRLEAELAACGNAPVLRSLHEAAISVTHEAADAFTKLEAALSDDAERYKEDRSNQARRVSKSTDEITTRSEDLRKRLVSPKAKGDLLLQADVATAHLDAMNLQLKIINMGLGEAQRARFMNEVKQSTEVLFERILAPERKQFSFKAVKSGLGFGVGLVPYLGPLVDGVTKSWDLWKRHQKRAGTAGEHERYLAEYYGALKLWISRAERLTDHLSNTIYP